MDEAEASLVGHGQSFDVNRYFEVLPHLSMEQGYVLDYAYQPNIWPNIYARKSDEPRCRDPLDLFDRRVDRITAEAEAWFVGYGACGFHHHVRVDDTEDGFFQLVLLLVMGGQFYLWWHALYNDTTIVCTRAAFEARLEKDAFIDARLRSRLLKQTRRLNLSPEVQIGDEQVLVRVAQFTKWGGLLSATSYVQRRFPHEILDSRTENLVPYNCGIRF